MNISHSLSREEHYVRYGPVTWFSLNLIDCDIILKAQKIDDDGPWRWLGFYKQNFKNTHSV